MKRSLLLFSLLIGLPAAWLFAQTPMEDARESFRVLRAIQDGDTTDVYTPVDPPKRTRGTDLHWYRTEGRRYGIDETTIGAWPGCAEAGELSDIADCTRERLDVFLLEKIQEVLPYTTDTIFLHLTLHYDGRVTYHSAHPVSGDSYGYLLEEIAAALPRFEPVESEHRKDYKPGLGQILVRKLVVKPEE